jgi:hypothetical protein
MTVVVSLISVLESGFLPFGGTAAPPNTLVSRCMKVLFPHPESAARPITTGLSTEHETWKQVLEPPCLLLLLLLLVKKMTCFCLKPVFETVVHGECREVVLCVLQVAIVAFWVVFSVKLLFLPSSLGWWDLKRRREESGGMVWMQC